MVDYLKSTVSSVKHTFSFTRVSLLVVDCPTSGLCGPTITTPVVLSARTLILDQVSFSPLKGPDTSSSRHRGSCTRRLVGPVIATSCRLRRRVSQTPSTTVTWSHPLSTGV